MLGAFLGGAVTDISDNFNVDRQSKREIEKANAIAKFKHGLNMTEITSRQGFMDEREKSRQSHESQLQKDRIAANEAAAAKQNAWNVANRLQTDAEGNVYRGGKAEMIQTPDTQYQSDDENMLGDPIFGVSEETRAGLKNAGERKQLNTGVTSRSDWKLVDVTDPNAPLDADGKRQTMSMLLNQSTGQLKPAGSINPEMAGPTSREEAIAGFKKAHENASDEDIEKAIAHYFPQFAKPSPGGVSDSQTATEEPVEEGTWAATEPAEIKGTPFEPDTGEVGMTQEGMLGPGGTFTTDPLQSEEKIVQGYNELLEDEDMTKARDGDKSAAKTLLRRLAIIREHAKNVGVDFKKPPYIHMERLHSWLQSVVK